MHELKKIVVGESTLVLLPREDKGLEDIVVEGKLLKAFSASSALDSKMFFVKERARSGEHALDAAGEARMASFINRLNVADVVAEQPIAVIADGRKERVVYRSVRQQRVNSRMFQLKLLKALFSLDSLGVLPGQVVKTANAALQPLYGEDGKLHFFDLESWRVKDQRVLNALA